MPGDMRRLFGRSNASILITGNISYSAILQFGKTPAGQTFIQPPDPSAIGWKTILCSIKLSLFHLGRPLFCYSRRPITHDAELDSMLMPTSNLLYW